MPKPPSYLDKFNTITRFIENPCHAPWTVYFETALPFIGIGVMELLAFDLVDIIRGYARPRGLRRGRHGGFRRNRRRRGGGIPEIGEMIGERLPGAERLKGRFIDDGVRHLWLIDGVIQRVLFYWLIADITLDVFYNTMTAIQATEFCTKQGGGMMKTKDKALKAGVLLCQGHTNWEWSYPFSGPVIDGAVSGFGNPAEIVGAATIFPAFGHSGWIDVIVPGFPSGRSNTYTTLIPGIPFRTVARARAPAGHSGVLRTCGTSFVEADNLVLTAIPL